MSNSEISIGSRLASGGSQASVSQNGSDGKTIVGSGSANAPYSAIGAGLLQPFVSIHAEGTRTRPQDFFGLWQACETDLLPGAAVCIHDSGLGQSYKQIGANAGDATRSSVIGLSLGAKVSDKTARFISNGLLFLENAQWDAVIQPDTNNGRSGLIMGGVYYLSPSITGGQIRVNFPTETKEGLPPWIEDETMFYVRIGKALDPRTMMIQIGNFTQGPNT